jgi:hypothetical protein
MAQVNATMEAQLQAAIAAGTWPQRYRTSVAQFIRAPGGRRIKLINADSQPTAEGRYYYAQLGVDVPRLYVYEQPLINDKWVMAFDGTRVKVRERNSDGAWRITKKGEDYFRYNRNQYLPSVPFLIAKKLVQREGGGYDGTVVASEYMPSDLAIAG